MPVQVTERVELRQLLTNKEAMEYLGMSEVTGWRERAAGRLNFRRCGGKLRYTIDDLNAYIDAAKNRPSRQQFSVV